MSNKILISYANNFDLALKAVEPREKIAPPTATSTATAAFLPGAPVLTVAPPAPPSRPMGLRKEPNDFPLVNVVKRNPPYADKGTLITSLHTNPKRFTDTVIEFAREYSATSANPLPLYMVHDDVVLDPEEKGVFGTTVANTIHSTYKAGKDFIPGEELNYQLLINDALVAAGLQKDSVKVYVANSDINKAMIQFTGEDSRLVHGQNLIVWKSGQRPQIVIAKNWDTASKQFQDGLETIDLKTVEIPSNVTDGLDDVFRLGLEGSKQAKNLGMLLKPGYIVHLIQNIIDKLGRELRATGLDREQKVFNAFVTFFKPTRDHLDKIRSSGLIKGTETIIDLGRFKSLVEAQDPLAEMIAKFLRQYISNVLVTLNLPSNSLNLVNSDDFDLIFTPDQKSGLLNIKALDPTDPRAEFGGAKYLAYLHQKSLGNLV